ncbi:MAG: hypothetical protein ABW185_04765 [Sedimenticola sp.]
MLSVEKKCKERSDTWSNEVHVRIQNIGDAVAAEVKYHHDCQTNFYVRRDPPMNPVKTHKGRPRGSVDSVKNDAFMKLCDFLDEQEEVHQFSLSELHELLEKFSHDGEVYTTKQLSTKLQERYNEHMVITTEQGKNTLYTFLNESNKILRDHYKATGITPEEIVDMAGTLIDDEIRSSVNNVHHYPKFSEITDLDKMENNVSKLLLRLLGHLINSRRRRIALSHSITSAARPRSFISPILLAISVYCNSKLESRELVDMLSSLAFADDYREVLRLYDARLPTGEKQYQWVNAIVNFVFDNADIDTRTLTGHDTWHVLGGIAGVTPAGECVEKELPRSTNVRSAIASGQFAEIPVRKFTKPQVPGLKSVFIGPLEPPNNNPPSLKLAKALDNVWMTSFAVPELVRCPSWSGFNQTVMKQGTYEVSRIDVLPFINLNPNHPDTLYSALSYAQDLSLKYKLGVAPVTFDQPLYQKAAEIVQASPELNMLVVRLGGVHLMMSYMGAIGHIMSESGLAVQWETVYAPNTVKHMLTGHAYARALRAHMLSVSSLVGKMLDTQESLSGLNLDRLKAIHEMLLREEYDVDDIQPELVVNQLIETLDGLENDLAAESRTGKLWLDYLKMVRLMLLFLRAERTGDWELHMYCVDAMIPICHAGGHLAYARCARLYHQQMKKLSTIMSDVQYDQYARSGYWTIRRSDRFWSGIFTDQTIEQVLMRMLKTRGGLNHGRGITSSTQSKMVHVMPQTVPVCESLENFCGIETQTSDQHSDLRATTTARDGQHYDLFRNWFDDHSPFSYAGEHCDSLVSVSTGIVAPKSANADRAFEIGRESAEHLTGDNYADAKLKRKDRVISIGTASNGVTVRDEEVEVDPTLLFMRVTCVIKQPSDMEYHLKHEFSKQPPALFDKGLMRKNTKSVLANQLKAPVTPVSSDDIQDPYYVVDGGYLLQSVSWPTDIEGCTYGNICDTHVSHVLSSYGKCTVCFDGYATMSTNVVEQNRRSLRQTTSADIVVDLHRPISTDQRSFLANRTNKSALIELVKEKLTAEGVVCLQAAADADYLLTSTTVNYAEVHDTRSVALVGTDTDLLVMLVDRVTTTNVYMRYSKNDVYNISDIQQTMHAQSRQHILLAHAITGCDTVSALYSIGKKKAITVVERHADCDELDVFQKHDASHAEVARVGESFLLKLYNAKQSVSLDKLRYVRYMQKVSKTSSSFKLESLPPTTAAAKYHTYRTYFAIQEWLGNVGDLEPTHWGWVRTDSMLTPIMTDMPVAPERVLKIVSCGCKKGCTKRCMCRKSGLYCTTMCSICIGQSCANAYPPDGDDEL